MESGNGNSNGHKANGKTKAETTPRQPEDVIWQEEEVPEHERKTGLAERIERLDEIRRVARRDRARLFLRAVPTEDYLVLLSQAGELKARAVPETDCHLNAATGEAFCFQKGDPGKDCRQSWCRYAVLMRMRLINRLGHAYALERIRLGVA